MSTRLIYICARCGASFGGSRPLSGEHSYMLQHPTQTVCRGQIVVIRAEVVTPDERAV